MSTYKYIDHRFGPSETIRAIIRRYNHLDITPAMQDKLIAEFNKINGEEVPKAGQTVKIPIFTGFVGAHPSSR